MSSLADFQERFPEFADIASSRIQLFLDDASLLMNSPTRWLEFYDVAHCYYAAHLLYVGMHTEQGDGTVLAPIKKQEVDDVIIEQAVGSVKASAENLHSTAYGKRYYEYRKICFAGIYGV